MDFRPRAATRPWLILATLVGLIALPAGPAQAFPICPGPNRLPCGGRIIPEPIGSLGFLTYDEWTTAMQTLQAEHPDRVRFDQIGKTAGGRPLYEVVVTDFRDPRPMSKRRGLFFNGDIHGDERDGTEGFARVIEDLAESTDPAIASQLAREVLVFTDANPDGWQAGDVPAGLTASNGPVFTRENAPGHDLNREWPIVGYQNPETFPMVDPEVQGIVQAHGNLLHRRIGVPFDFGFDVHGSAGAKTPPEPQLMLDVLLSAGEFDLGRTLRSTEVASTYMERLRSTASSDPLATVGQLTDERIYSVGDWETSWDIYGYTVSGGFSDWMSDSDTGLGAVSATVELWVNGEPGQENTFVGYDPLIGASNVHAMRVLVGTAMDLAILKQRAELHLPGPIAYVRNGFALHQGDGKGSTKPVGPQSVRPPSHPYPSGTDRFFRDLGRFTDHPVVGVSAGNVGSSADLSRYRAVVVAQDPHLGGRTFIAALKGYARSGGTVVLTDAALGDLVPLGVVGSGAVGSEKVYAGYADVSNRSDPLARGMRPNAKQTYEPVPLGYEISNTFSSSSSVFTSPEWWVARGPWQEAGGRTVGTAGGGHVVLGEVPLGRGRVRVIGALLPNPSGNYAHPFGVADYALTYTGYILLENALRARPKLETVGYR
jgi:hypothetical protein